MTLSPLSPRAPRSSTPPAAGLDPADSPRRPAPPPLSPLAPLPPEKPLQPGENTEPAPLAASGDAAVPNALADGAGVPSALADGAGAPSALADGAGAPAWERYRIATADTADLRPLPHRFRVEVRRLRLAKLLATEVWRYFGKWDAVLNRPCIYGVFSGPVGGFAPRSEHCVGCLRCTIQHPDVVRIVPNPELRKWGDDYCTARQVETIFYEAKKGRVPVKGQGYRGRFGGEGWDGMWTDMSEIVRPTRDGIHGREFISTVVDVGGRLEHLELTAEGDLAAPPPPTLTLQLPLLFDPPAELLRGPAAAEEILPPIWARVAAELDTLAILPVATIRRHGLAGPALVPLVRAGEPGELAELAALPFAPRLIELAGWEAALAPAAPAARAAALVARTAQAEPPATAAMAPQPAAAPAAMSVPDAISAIGRLHPQALVALRLPFAAGWQERLLAAHAAGVRIFHLEADYHGRGEREESGESGFLLDLLIEANRMLVASGIRDQVTLLGSGGIVAAEHVPKAIIAGLDAVALDTALLLALQFRPCGRFAARGEARFEPPPGLTLEWGTQRLLNLCAAWRDQLLEVMGAMGLREVRRLRGELGRAMFQRDLEREAFGEIDGFAPAGEAAAAAP